MLGHVTPEEAEQAWWEMELEVSEPEQFWNGEWRSPNCESSGYLALPLWTDRRPHATTAPLTAGQNSKRLSPSRAFLKTSSMMLYELI